MNDVKLHDALHEVASTGVGEGVDVRLARMSADARAVGRRQTRRRWFGVAGTMVATAAVVLLVAGLFAVTRPVEVVPASGAGSLPDRIFPTREHILTLEQAPIGRVSMVYATSALTSEAPGPAWIAVGADTNEYRWVAPAEAISPPPGEMVQISPSGTHLALSTSGDSAEAFGVEVVDARTGQSRSVLDGQQAALGGEVETLAWSPDGDSLFVSALVVVERLSDTARRLEPRHFVISGLGTATGAPRVEANETPLTGQMVGWSGGEPVILLAKAPTLLSEPRIRRHDLVTEKSLRVLGRVPEAPSMTGGMALSPDGRLLAAVLDPTPSSSGDGRPWRLQVFDTQSGEMVWQSQDVPEDLSAMVGWRDARTPVLYTAGPGEDRRAAPLAQVAEYPLGVAEAARIVDLGLPSEVGAYVSNAALAADVLASGNVRVAEPPHQPWYDPRTLVPTVTGWLGDNTAAGVLLGLLGVALLVVVVRVSRQRRRTRPGPALPGSSPSGPRA
jgi:hypothetical protein